MQRLSAPYRSYDVIRSVETMGLITVTHFASLLEATVEARRIHRDDPGVVLSCEGTCWHVCGFGFIEVREKASLSAVA